MDAARGRIQTPGEPIRAVIDCDTGIDDALMLLYLAACPDVELVAVGTVHGNVEADRAAANTLAVLELVGRPDVPVAVGARRPLAQPLHTSGLVHGAQGLGDVDVPVARRAVEPVSAAEQLVGLARAHPGALDLLASGPATNLALALLLEPDLPRLLRRVVFMGGAVAVPGNASAAAEANVWHDPEAADLVFQAGWDLTLVGLDVTSLAELSGARLERLRGSDTSVARFATGVLDHYVDYYAGFRGRSGALMHDPLAAGLLREPGLARYESRALAVDLSRGPSRGRTLADLRGYLELDEFSGRPPVSVAVGIAADRFLDDFVDRLTGATADHRHPVAD